MRIKWEKKGGKTQTAGVLELGLNARLTANGDTMSCVRVIVIFLGHDQLKCPKVSAANGSQRRNRKFHQFNDFPSTISQPLPLTLAMGNGHSHIWVKAPMSTDNCRISLQSTD
uniref:HDC14482 n=1 Tax=Drosophila melanogaster TaxID=7227 RepID=Q6IJP7_DROME|nr:TPA_inf: HDC14482 [Drosophila melanogaster]